MSWQKRLPSPQEFATEGKDVKRQRDSRKDDIGNRRICERVEESAESC